MATNCNILESWLADQPDPVSVGIPAEHADHVASCADCAERWRSEQMLRAAIAAWRAAPVVPPNSARLLEGLRRERLLSRAAPVRHPEVAPGRQAWWLVAASSAAMVALAWGLAWYPEEPAAKVARSSNSAGPSVAVTETIESVFQGIEVTSPTVTATSPVELPSLADWERASSLEMLPEINLSRAVAETGAGWLRFGRPLGDGVGRAFQFLQVAVPGNADAG